MSHRDDLPFPRLPGAEADREELERVWSLLGRAGAAPPSAEETHAAWRALARRLGLDHPTRAPAAGAAPPSPRPALVPGARGPRRAPRAGGAARRRPARILGGAGALLRAAVLAGILLAGVAAWYQLPVTRSAAPGERITLRLPDGSEATLNAGSSVRYRRGFSLLPGVPAGAREVRLRGEAFFDVTTAERPFRVAAGDASVRVLGTRFNVRARPAGLEVAVAEGRVEVARRGGAGALVLGGGEGVRLGAGEARLTRVRFPLDRVGAWRSGGLTVVDEPLSAVLSELSRRFAVEIDLAEAADGGERLSVYYPSLGPLESVLSDLTIQQDLRYRRTAEGWEVF